MVKGSGVFYLACRGLTLDYRNVQNKWVNVLMFLRNVPSLHTRVSLRQ